MAQVTLYLDEETAAKLKAAVRLLQVPPREVAISSITVYELEVGLARSSATM